MPIERAAKIHQFLGTATRAGLNKWPPAVGRFFFCATISAGVVAAPFAWAETPKVWVERCGFYDGVGADFNPLNPIPSGTRRPPKLYFWSKVRGNEGTLDELKRLHVLPITHRWVKAAGSVVVATENAPTPTEIKLLVGSAETLTKLGWEVQRRHSFGWRTWSRKLSYGPGDWVVEILDGQGHRLQPGPDSGDCERSLRIRN